MGRQGQATIYVVVGVLIVAGVAGAVFSDDINRALGATAEPDQAQFQGFFESFGTDNTVLGFDQNAPVFDDDDQTQEGNATRQYSLTSVANETVQSASDASDNGWIKLNNEHIENSETVWNQTGNSVIAESNYNMNFTNGAIDLTASVEASNTQVTIDYNHMQNRTDTNALEVPFEIENTAAGATIEWTWESNNITDDQTEIDSAEINNEDTGETIDLDAGTLDEEDELTLDQQLQADDYNLRLYFDHVDEVPNWNSGNNESFGRFDIELDAEDAPSDEPTEVSSFDVFAWTTPP